MNFVSDQLANGRQFRVLNIVDDLSRECVGQVVDVSISGLRVHYNEVRPHRSLSGQPPAVFAREAA